MKEFEINLKDDIISQVKECIKKSDIGKSPAGGKTFICKSKDFNDIRNFNVSRFKNKIIQELTNLQNNQDVCIVNISVAPAPEQTQEPKQQTRKAPKI